MTQINTVVNMAASQIGTAEDPKGSNNIKYNTDYYGRVVSGSAYPWCMAFVWWVFNQAGLSRLFYGGRKTASCTTLMNWAKSNGYIVTSGYQAGDVFFYDWDGASYDAEHTGIYTGLKDSSGRYLVIEGNTNDRVEQIGRSTTSVLCAFRPQWEDEEPAPAPTPAPSDGKIITISLPELRRNSVGKSVKAMQNLLIGYGYSCGPDGADGEYGLNTLDAVKRYQGSHGLAADGICGVLTWTSLLK